MSEELEKPAPSTLGSDGKDKKGRFAKGNKLGQGNPLAGQAAKIRAELLASTTPKDRKLIIGKLVEGAKAGDLAFIREFFDRTIGKSIQHSEIESTSTVTLSPSGYDLSRLSEADLETMRSIALKAVDGSDV